MIKRGAEPCVMFALYSFSTDTLTAGRIGSDYPKPTRNLPPIYMLAGLPEGTSGLVSNTQEPI
jgi:hypothetical protein